MKRTNLSVFIASLLFAIVSLTVQAQALKTPAPSPSASIKQSFGIGEITVEYSRPSVRGRVVFGELIPYGKVWRTGANASTKITFTDDVTIEETAVKAGTYAIYTIPNKDNWEVILYSDLTLNGNVAAYKPENEVAHVKVKTSSLENKVEMFTINISDVTSTTAVLEFTWDKVRVPVKISTDIDAKIMKNIETALATDSRPYFQAATYYYDNNKDLNQALIWINKAVEQNPKAFWMTMQKARIELKLKDTKAAIASAEKTKALATEANNDDYVKMADELIAQAKKK